MQLVAPTSTDERIGLAAETTHGWLYLVTVTGTTGTRTELAPSLAPLAARAARRPTCRSTPASASRRRSTPRAAAALVDGIVVGSRAVEAAEQGPQALAELVGSLRTGLDAA